MNGRPGGAASRAFAAGAALFLSTVAVIVGAGFAEPARPDRPAGVLFAPGTDAAEAVAALRAAEADIRVVDLLFGRTLFIVRYAEPGFPERARAAGALHVFDAVAAGCA